MGHSDSASLAVEALLAIGPDTIDALLAAVANLEFDDFYGGVQALCAFGEPGLGRLRELATEPTTAGLVATLALTELAPTEAVTPLIAALRQNREGWQYPIVGALRRLGPLAADAVPVLRAHLLDPECSFADGVGAALLAIAPDLDALRQDLASPDPAMRRVSVRLLFYFAEDGQAEARRWLLASLSDGDADVRLAAVESLSGLLRAEQDGRRRTAPSPVGRY